MSVIREALINSVEGRRTVLRFAHNRPRPQLISVSLGEGGMNRE